MTHIKIEGKSHTMEYVVAAAIGDVCISFAPATIQKFFSTSQQAQQEDHNPGSINTIKCDQLSQCVEHVAVIEFIASGQAVDFHRQKKCGGESGAADEFIRPTVPHHNQ